MPQAKNHIVYQCYGHESIFHECAFSLLSLARASSKEFLADCDIWIYTDRPEWFTTFKDNDLPLNFRKITEQEIKKWRGAINFTHRVKIEVLRDLCNHVDGNMLYLDTDTILLESLDSVFKHIDDGALYMHTAEGKISDEGNPVLKKLNAYLKQQKHYTAKTGSVNNLQMWNAGVLGFNTGQQRMLADVLAFTDKVHSEFPKHIVEQFAFSFYFQQAADIKAAAPYILHYWNLKEVRPVLKSFFEYFRNAGWNELVQLGQLVQMHVLMQEKANYYQNRSIGGKLQKQLWQPAPFHWQELMKQL